MGGEVEEPQKDPKVEEKELVPTLVAPNEYVGPSDDVCVYGGLVAFGALILTFQALIRGYFVGTLFLVALFFVVRRWFWSSELWDKWEISDQANYLYRKMFMVGLRHYCTPWDSRERVCEAFNEAAHIWKTKNAGHLPTHTASFLFRWNMHKKVSVPTQNFSLRTLALNCVVWFGACTQKLAAAAYPEMNPSARVENTACKGCANNETHICKAVPITPVARAAPAGNGWDARVAEIGLEYEKNDLLVEAKAPNRFQLALLKYKLAEDHVEVDRVVKVAVDFVGAMIGNIPFEVPEQVLQDGFLLVETSMKEASPFVSQNLESFHYFDKIEFVKQSDKCFYKFQ